MTNLTETAQWDAGIRQIGTTDPVMGGPGGIANLQAQSLANRTAWLRSILTPYTTGGTSSAYTLTPDAPLPANAAWARYAVVFSLAGTGTPTLAVSGKAPLPLVRLDASGSLVACLPSASLVSDVLCDGTHWIVLDPLPINLAAPGPIGGTTPAAVTGTTVTANTQFNGPGTGLTGTALNLVSGNSNQLLGKTWAAPAALGSTTPAAVTGTTITATTQFSGPGTGLTGTATGFIAGSANQLLGSTWAAPAALGSTTPAAVTGTTVTATSQFSGPGTGLTGTATNLTAGNASQLLSKTWAAPAALGSTTPAAVTGTTVTATAQFTGPGTGLTGMAAGLSIGGNAATVTTIRAWCNVTGFNSPVINSSFNVSSVTVNGNGNYTVNFATALPDANYAAVVTEIDNSWNQYDIVGTQSSTPSSVVILVRGTGGASSTPAGLSVICLR